MPEFHKMGVTEQNALTKKISRNLFVTELQLNYENVNGKAMEHGLINDKMPMMAENIQGIFSVEAKKKKNPESIILRLPRIVRRRLEARVYLPELPRKRRNPRRRSILSRLNRSAGHPATGIIPSQETKKTRHFNSRTYKEQSWGLPMDQ